MDSQIHHPNLVHLPPNPYPGHQYASQISFGSNENSARARNSTPTSVTVNSPFVRIATLENEVEHLRVEKATAELAVQYLANVAAKGQSDGDCIDKQLAKLKVELMRANEERLVLKAKLENSQTTIASLVTCMNLTPVSNSVSTIQGNGQKTGELEIGDLIDFAVPLKDPNHARPTEDNNTLVDTSNDEISDGAIGAKGVDTVPSLNATESVASSESKYIHHFVSKNDAQKHNIEPKTASHLVKNRLTYAKETVLSSDQYSETSIEPKSDESYQTSLASSEGPTSLSNSFITALSGSVSDVENVQTSGVHQWRQVCKSSSPALVSPSNAELMSKNRVEMEEKSKSPEFAFAKVSLGPALQKPSWKVSDVLFDTGFERMVASHKREASSTEHRLPGFFKYGIRFQPDADEHEIYRTVLISDLPVDTIIHQVFEKVRGGVVVDAKLLNLSQSLGGKSALVVFLHEYAAVAYEEYAKSHPIIINGSLAKVQVLPTPTWPLSPGIQTAIDSYQHSRCLEIHKFPRKQISVSKLRSDLRVCAQMHGDRIEYMKMRENGILDLHFTSINQAGHGFGMFTTFKAYKGCKAWFVPDPCAQSVDTLKASESGLDDCATSSQQIGPGIGAPDQ